MAAAIRVLYVDDEPGLLTRMKLFLERVGEFAGMRREIVYRSCQIR